MNATARTRTATVLLLAAALIALAASTGCTTRVVTAPAGSAPNSVTASGSGRVSATPDEATMNFGVSARAAEADKALENASKTATKIADAVMAEGVDKKDIQTAGVNVYPRNDNSGKIIGYEASLDLSVKVRDLAKIGEVIAAANGAGANNISGPSFGIADDSDYRSAAIEEAVADARKSAAAMAKAAKLTLGEVISITSSQVNVPMPQGGRAFDSTKLSAGSIAVEPGQLDVTADLTVVFELK